MASEEVLEPDLESEEVLELDKFVEGENQKLPRSGLHLDDIECLQGEEHILKTLQNDSLYVGRKLVTDIRVPGNIHKEEYRDFWIHDLKPSSFVVDVIESGYKLPFKEIPPPSFEGNNCKVKRLESLGCVEKVFEKPYLVLPLSSVFSKKKRLVVDASRALNPFLKHRRVRLQVGVFEF